MGKLRKIHIDSSMKAELELGYRRGKSHCFRKRCHCILLKAQGYSSKEVGKIVGLHQASVNNWLNRYESEGISGLKNKPGQGRKTILNKETDDTAIRKAVQQERQRLGQAKRILEEELDKRFCLKTLKRYIKKLTAATSEFA